MLRTVRGQSLLAGIALLVVFGTMAGLAIWRTNSDRAHHKALNQRSEAVAALQETRAQFYLASGLLALSGLAEDHVPLINSYGEALDSGMSSLQQAENSFRAEGDFQTLSTLENLDKDVQQLLPAVDAMVATASNDRSPDSAQSRLAIP